MTTTRRAVLASVSPHPTTHAGLWLDRYLSAQGDDEARWDLVQTVAQIRHADLYPAFYARWKAALQAAGAQTREAEVLTRLAINLGAESVLETAIALHRTYGVPYIPGSALKGLAAHYAHRYLEGDAWRKGQWAHGILFGTPKQAGRVTFFDALYVPGSGVKGQALWPDVIAVHHPAYYRRPDAPPADWDSPTPIPFLTATGRYLIALAGPAPWVQAAFQILELALAEEGIGARTSSGYGRLRLTTDRGAEIERRGVIARYDPRRGKGVVRDEESGEEYPFTREVLPGRQDLPRRQKVYFKVWTGTGEVTAIRKRYT